MGQTRRVKLVPIIKCRDLARSVAFYTEILDFELADPGDDSPVIDLVHGDAVLQLSTMSGDSLFGVAVNVRVADVDAAFARYVARGLDTSHHTSPVHRAPLDQTWGLREVYIDDPDGNTLRFSSPIRE